MIQILYNKNFLNLKELIINDLTTHQYNSMFLGESNLNPCENANLEPPSKETPASTAISSVPNQNSSSNMNYTDYHVKKRK